MVKVSAIVVGRNEGIKLENCLKSILWCNEIIYADLDSNDNSIEIATKFNCKIKQFKRFGPSCEYTQSILIHEVENKWVLFLDPDECVSEQLKIEIIDLLPKIDKNTSIGSVLIPWQFYFANYQLKGTVWGWDKKKEVLVNKEGFEVLPITHFGRRLKSGYISYSLDKNIKNNVLHHYWMDDISSFIKKHNKYLKDEGHDRFNEGKKIGILKLLLLIPYQFYFCYITKRGYKDGFIGIFLSLFWVYYTFVSNCTLFYLCIMQKAKKLNHFVNE